MTERIKEKKKVGKVEVVVLEAPLATVIKK